MKNRKTNVTVTIRYHSGECILPYHLYLRVKTKKEASNKELKFRSADETVEAVAHQLNSARGTDTSFYISEDELRGDSDHGSAGYLIDNMVEYYNEIRAGARRYAARVPIPDRKRRVEDREKYVIRDTNKKPLAIAEGFAEAIRTVAELSLYGKSEYSCHLANEKELIEARREMQELLN